MKTVPQRQIARIVGRPMAWTVELRGGDEGRNIGNLTGG